MANETNIPQHVAIILDGNGRWAKKRMMPRNYGHAKGAKTVEQICEDAYKMGIKYLTVYAFSTENWKRPKEEVDALMKLLRDYLANCIDTANKNKMFINKINVFFIIPHFRYIPIDIKFKKNIKLLSNFNYS